MSEYKFSRRIGRGGMAEVFLGMQEGLGGFEKLVVIKRIFRNFSEDENFVRMFLDEARLAASIHHPNVVQILDIGRDEDGFFIVMEYLSGETVAYLFEALRAKSRTIPPYIVCRIGAEIAAGLHHAHTATDAVGNPQPIVHRDVTPSNLLVCFNGVVKVVDFGVAKATLSDGHTQVGALKGKMSYLAPEQVLDLPVDGRTDVFQLGVCLHEILTGRRLFGGESDHQKMTAVMERPIPRPSRIVPAIPAALDDVVLRALERDPDRRPQSADVLRRELEAVLAQAGTTVSDHDLGEWMQETFTERRAERLAMERSCVSQMRGRRSSEVAPAASGTQIPVYTGGDGSGQRTPTMATVLQRGGQKSGTASTSILTARQGWAIAAVLVLFIGGVSVSAWKLSGNAPDAEEKVSVADLEPEGATGPGAAEQGATAPSPGEADQDGEAPPTPSATRPDQDEARAEPSGPAAEPDPDRPRAEPSATFEARVEVEPAEAVLVLDGHEVGTGSFETELPIDGRHHKLRVSADGYRTRTLTFADAPPPARIELERRKHRRKEIGAASTTGAPKEQGDGASQKESPPDKEGRRPLTDNMDPWAH